jgi:hypothetical protein
VAENVLAKMEELIRRVIPPGQTLSKRTLQRRTNSCRYGIEVFDRALANMHKNGEILFPVQKGKTILYTRAEIDGEEEAVVSDVIGTDDDGRTLANPNKYAPFAGCPRDSHQAFVAEPCANDQRFM